MKSDEVSQALVRYGEDRRESPGKQQEEFEVASPSQGVELEADIAHVRPGGEAVNIGKN